MKNTNKISYDEYIKKSKTDEINMLKALLVIISVIVIIFSFYNIFLGPNGLRSQRSKAQELTKMKALEEEKDKELIEKTKLLRNIRKGDKETIEKLAREKGYIYENEKIIKIPALENQNNENLNEENSVKSESNEPNSTVYLIISIIIAVGVIVVSFFVNRKKTIKSPVKRLSEDRAMI